MTNNEKTVADALTIESLAQEIRRVDGNHDLGAGRLAEAIFPFIERAIANAAPPAAEASGSAPDGMALVPARMFVSPEQWEAAQIAFGGPGSSEGEPFYDCTLWVGEIENDDGTKTHGLHVSCDECPEEGSITLSEFPVCATPPASAPDGSEEVAAYLRSEGLLDQGDTDCVAAIRAVVEDRIRLAKLAANLHAAATPPASAPEVSDATDADIEAWLERHDISHAIRGADARAAFEDAQSWHLTAALQEGKTND